jgi:hypothetical protein
MTKNENRSPLGDKTNQMKSMIRKRLAIGLLLGFLIASQMPSIPGFGLLYATIGLGIQEFLSNMVYAKRSLG